MTKRELSKLTGIDVKYFEGEYYDGSLDLSSLTELPENTTFNVGDWLDLRSLTELPENTTFNVGSSLNLSSLTELPENTTFNVGGWLYLRSLTELPENTTFNVGDWLDLRSLTELPENTTFNVGSSLNLSSLTELPENTTFNVGGWLYLNFLTELPENYQSVRNRYNGYMELGTLVKCDGITSFLVSKRDNVTKTRDFKGKYGYIVSEGNFHAHGDTLKKAKADLQYKIAADKLKKEPIANNTPMTIAHYRAITGACEQGVNDWLKTTGVEEGILAIDLLPILERTQAYGLETFKRLLNN